MPKTTDAFDPAAYTPVAERITLFYAQHPTGRIVTELIARSDHDVVFRASVYRATDDPAPAATGWAAEREGDGDVNLVACLENTETSAIGRALANLGFTAGRQRPSAEEMQKAARARLRLSRGASAVREEPVAEPTASATRRAPITADAVQRRANLVLDLLRLIGQAERFGLRGARAERWRARLLADAPATPVLERVEQRLRAWARERRSN